MASIIQLAQRTAAETDPPAVMWLPHEVTLRGASDRAERASSRGFNLRSARA